MLLKHKKNLHNFDFLFLFFRLRKCSVLISKIEFLRYFLNYMYILCNSASVFSSTFNKSHCSSLLVLCGLWTGNEEFILNQRRKWCSLWTGCRSWVIEWHSRWMLLWWHKICIWISLVIQNRYSNKSLCSVRHICHIGCLQICRYDFLPFVSSILKPNFYLRFSQA